MATRKPIVVGPEDGEFLWFGAGLVTFKITSADSGDAFFLLEDRLERGKTTPLHVHPTHDETLCLVEGELLVEVDGVRHVATAGSVGFVPRGTPHAFLVTSATARLLAM